MKEAPRILKCSMGRKENNIDNLDLNLSTDFNLDLDLDENKDLVFPDGNEYFKNEDSRNTG